MAIYHNVFTYGFRVEDSGRQVWEVFNMNTGRVIATFDNETSTKRFSSAVNRAYTDAANDPGLIGFSE